MRHKSSASLMKQQLMKRYVSYQPQLASSARWVLSSHTLRTTHMLLQQFLDAILLLAGHARNCSRAGKAPHSELC